MLYIKKVRAPQVFLDVVLSVELRASCGRTFTKKCHFDAFGRQSAINFFFKKKPGNRISEDKIYIKTIILRQQEQLSSSE